MCVQTGSRVFSRPWKGEGSQQHPSPYCHRDSLVGARSSCTPSVPCPLAVKRHANQWWAALFLLVMVPAFCSRKHLFVTGPCAQGWTAVLPLCLQVPSPCLVLPARHMGLTEGLAREQARLPSVHSCDTCRRCLPKPFIVCKTIQVWMLWKTTVVVFGIRTFYHYTWLRLRTFTISVKYLICGSPSLGRCSGELDTEACLTQGETGPSPTPLKIGKILVGCSASVVVQPVCKG